jgi:hypothetical protein
LGSFLRLNSAFFNATVCRKENCSNFEMASFGNFHLPAPVWFDKKWLYLALPAFTGMTTDHGLLANQASVSVPLPALCQRTDNTTRQISTTTMSKAQLIIVLFYKYLILKHCGGQ